MVPISPQIVSKELVKPSSPTPPHLKTFNLTVVDRFMTSRYISVLFLFGAPREPYDTIISKLKTSLSNTLTQYYPYAGRLANDEKSAIDCNDEGVEFFESNMCCALSEILENPEYEIVDGLFPRDYFTSKVTRATSLLAIQVTSFACNGIALALCISHKVADGFSVATFMNDWAKVSHGERICPEFIATYTQPMEDISVDEDKIDDVGCVEKRFVFGSSSLANLKARAASSGVVTKFFNLEF